MDRILEADLRRDAAHEEYGEAVRQYVRYQMRKIQKEMPDHWMIFQAAPSRLGSRMAFYPDKGMALSVPFWQLPEGVRQATLVLCDWFDDLTDVYCDDIELEVVV
jgi:hypothetical protein